MGLLDMLGGLFGGGDQSQQLTQSSVGAPAQAPQQSGGLSPLATSLLAGYFSAIGSPKLAGWGGALSRGGLGALNAYSNASYLQSRQAQEAAYMRRALAQADKADAATNVPYYDPVTKTYHVVGPGQVPPQGSIPLNAMPSLIGAQNKTDNPKPVLKDLWNPKTGRNEPVYVKPGDQGQVMVGGQSDQDAQDTSGYKPIEQSGFQAKGAQSREDALQTVNQAMGMGNQLLEAMNKVDTEGGPPGRFMDVLGGMSYRFFHQGLPGQASQDEVRGYTQTLKQQLMGAAQKMSGSRAFGFVKLIQDHFPDMLDEASFKRGKLGIFLGENGVLKQIDHNIRYGASDQEMQSQIARYDQLLKATEGNEGASAAPPPPPVIPTGDPIMGPDGQMAIDGIDGNKYLYTPGVGWQRIKQ